MNAGKCWTQMGRADFDAAAPNELPMPAGPARIVAAPDRFGTAALFGDTVPNLSPRRSGREQPGDVDGQEELFWHPHPARSKSVSASTETLLSDVRSALHRRRVWSHSPDKDRPGWRAQPTLLDGIPAVILTWHGVKVPHSGMAELSGRSTAAGWLLHLERHLEQDFVVGRLYDERPRSRAARTLVALLVFHSGKAKAIPGEQINS